MSERRAVFLDRDGVINERLPGAYVRTYAEFRFRRGARAGLRLLREAGYLLIAVTNQRGIGRGLMQESDLAEVHRRMQADLARAGAALDDIFHCPHDLAADCACRKPRPGMLVRAIARHRVDPARSWIVGDSLSDLDAGRTLGIPGILVRSRGTAVPAGVRCAGSLLAAARLIAAGGRR
ncbi:MAG TPA: HAD family hydrolase [Candidatus Methanoperedens sp.]|nr:HAD family hydrolase [Candidatus Methanoperedens sp.]